MAISKKFLKLLDEKKIKYKILNHKKVYTALDKSKTLKVSPKKVVKTLVLKIDKNLVILNLRADQKVNFKNLQKFGRKISLPSEKEIKKKLKGIALGSVLPLGIFWKIKTLADASLKKQKEIILNSGDWKASISLSPKTIEKLNLEILWGNFGKSK
jgi:prolyl-tRNA editing enzyme YbaK/EbsC (Cys-tRNA(Pro) deacylase)